MPYWSLYLKSLGFGAQEIGSLMALIMATKIISPNVWGWIADHTGRRMNIVRIGCFFSVVCFSGIYISNHYWWLALVMVSFSFFWNAALPQLEATTFNHLQRHTHRYSNIRSWGSVGFILAVMALGPLLDHLGAQILPHIVLALFAGIWLSSLSVPEGMVHIPSRDHEPLLSVLKKPAVIALLMVCLLMQLSHGPYYTFYTIYMEEHGYSRTLIGQLWAWGVIAEVIVFLLLPKWVPRFGLRNLLIMSLVLAVLRWLLVGHFVQSLWIMIAAQTLHAATFGIYHACAIQLIHKYFSGRHQGKGQALYSSFSFGIGGAIGSLCSGYTWDWLGASVTFFIAAAVAGVAVFVTWAWIHPTPTPSSAGLSRK